ncbi:hypothetical protein D6T64_21625 [Cryobacterium melibiosiphilum]|uniref:ParA family protein n=1 Tax=Cryobacterium melibiosiphilum TaxID=995039 RepID=A0A3A5MDS0_9MICO|nr:hypothetical protein [Cryobacterium melibiosiphilum]RJT84747.1 hypothetical protein D6T64_21625 [Cryobacterium melibiosiphilum]
MSVIVLASLAGSPGVTTAAVGAALSWHRPAFLVEADTSKSSSILPGLLRGQVDHSRGLTPLSVDHLRGDLTVQSLWAQAIELAPERYLIPGFSSLQAARGTTTLWPALGSALAGLEGAGIDVIIDVGRISQNDARIPLLQQADCVVVVARPVLPDIAALAPRVGELVTAMTAAGHADLLHLLLVDSAVEGYTSPEITRVLGVPIVGRIEWDVRAAAVHSLGATPPPKYDRSAYRRSVHSTSLALVQAMEERATRLGVRPAPANARSDSRQEPALSEQIRTEVPL